MKVVRKADFGVGVFFLVFCIVYFVLAAQLPPSKIMDVGPDFMPKLYACIGALLSIGLIAGSFRPKAAEEGGEAEQKSEYDHVLLSFLLLIAYVMLLDLVGFLLMTALYLFFQMLVLAPKEKRKPALFAIIAVICAVTVFFVFRRAFEIQLPLGILKFIH